MALDKVEWQSSNKEGIQVWESCYGYVLRSSSGHWIPFLLYGMLATPIKLTNKEYSWAQDAKTLITKEARKRIKQGMYV